MNIYYFCDYCIFCHLFCCFRGGICLLLARINAILCTFLCFLVYPKAIGCVFYANVHHQSDKKGVRIKNDSISVKYKFPQVFFSKSKY